MKKLLLLFLFFVFASTTIFSQTAHIRDSFLNALQTLPANTRDTTRIELLRKLGTQYLNNKPDTALLLYQQSLDLALNLHDTLRQVKAIGNIGNAFLNLGDNPKALTFYAQVKSLGESIKDTAIVISTLSNIALAYEHNNELRKALDYGFQAYALVKITKNKRRTSESIIVSNIGSNYLNSNQLDSADFYLKTAEALCKRDYPEGLGEVYNNMGEVQNRRGHLEQAKTYFHEAIRILTETEDYHNLSNSTLNLSKVLEKTGPADSCLYYARQAVAYGQEGPFLEYILDAALYLDSLYEARHNSDSALHYYKIAVAAKDSFYSQDKVKQMLTIGFEEKQKQRELEIANDAAQKAYRNRIFFYVLGGGLLAALFIAALMYRNVRLRTKAYYNLNIQKQQTEVQRVNAEKSLQELKVTQKQLIQSEKMASLGELTAGIAHEIQNPLNFVNNFSEVNNELISEMVSEADKGNTQEVKAIANDIKQNLEKINHHGKRADAIVKGMLQHSRISTDQKEPTDINVLCDEYLRLSYHGLRAKDKTFNAAFKTEFDESVGKINIVPQDIGRVLLNLYNNAFYAVSEKNKLHPENYEPTVSVSTKKISNAVQLTVIDNGNGIPQKVFDKIFQPFFTTKPTGSGTGLGLSLAYDIIKAHGGEIKVETKEGEGSKFVIQLPVV